MPLSTIYAAIRKGLIRINGKRVQLNYKTAVGDTLTVAAAVLPSRLQSGASIADTKTQKTKRRGGSSLPFSDIPVLLAASDLLIINKPCGLSVHGSGSLTASLSGILSALPSGSEQPLSLSFKPGPLHRLDKNTTGVLCFSRTLAGAQWFSECLKKKTAGKYYIGIVRGNMPGQRISAGEGYEQTITQCYALEYNAAIDASLMLFKLITGKKHQIRIHTMNAGHPLAGDSRYCGGKPLPQCKTYLLHAWRLYFPETRPADIPLFIEAPFFPEMQGCLGRFFHWGHETIARSLEDCLPHRHRK